MQLIDGKLYPPMAAVVDGALVEPTELGKWYVADERPDLADESGRFKLDKGNGSSIKAAYNPYWHTSRSPLNDQFSSAWKRTNLVTVECEVPASELTSGYKAEKAKDSVGEMDWHSGPVSSKLAKVGRRRKVILSRYVKVLRVVPNTEVARAVSNVLEGTDVAVPANTVTPSLRKELLALGVNVTPTNKVPDVFAMKPPVRSVSDETKALFALDEKTDDWTIMAEPNDIANLPVRHMPKVDPITESTDNNSVEKALQSMFETFNEVTNEETGEPVVFNRSDAGKMVMFGGVDMRKFGRLLKPLFEQASLAWTEPERAMDRHKFHEDVEQYRQYVAKFDGYTDAEHGIDGAAFVRFTVRVMNTGRHDVHAASISDISVIQKQKGGPQPVPARKLGGIGDLALRGRTLAKFLSKGKNEFSDPESRVRSRGAGESAPMVVAEPALASHLAAVGVPAERRAEAARAIQQELFAIDEMSKDGFLYSSSPEAEAAKPFALATRFRALETGGAFIVTLDRKCKLTGVSKMTPDELARPDAGREMLRRVQRVKEACCWMIVVGDAGIDLDRFARRSSGGMDARIGKPLVDVFLRDESGKFYSTRRQGVLRFDEYSGFEGATYDEMRRLGLTRDTVERYVAEHPAPRMEAAEPASRVRSRGASDATLEAAKLDRATYEAFTDSEDAVFHSFVNPDGTMKPGWMKAPNGKKLHLSPRQFVQVRTQEFKAWFGDWEARYYSQGWKDKIDPGAILSLPAVDISGYAPLADKAAIAEAFEEFGEVANKNDGRKVRFPSNVAGRMVFHKRTAAAFKELFESSVRAWSENETHFEGHKAHSNIRAYHQYVNKFTDTEGEHFVRFTVREDNPGKGAQNNVHAAVVTNVELLENGSDSTLPDSSTGRSESLAQGISPRADKKLALFISDFKPENVS